MSASGNDGSCGPYRSFKDFQHAFLSNVAATSGTAATGRQMGNRGRRSGKPYAGMHGVELQLRVQRNMSNLSEKIARAAQEKWPVRTFMAQAIRTIHYGLPNAKRLRKLRTHETRHEYGCPAEEVPERYEAFIIQVETALDDTDSDPFLLAAYVEHQLRFALHPFSDGCGRIATATAAWVMLRSGKRIPRYVMDRSLWHDSLRLHFESEFVPFYCSNCFSTENGGDSQGRHPFLVGLNSPDAKEVA